MPPPTEPAIDHTPDAAPALAAFSMRIEDLVLPPVPTPLWDDMVTEFGDPIPHLPAPSWPGDAPEETAPDDDTHDDPDQ